MMKRAISLLLTLSLLTSLLAACQPSAVGPDPDGSDQPSASAPGDELSCVQIVTGVLQALDMEGSVTVFYGAEDEEPERLSGYLEEAYGLSDGEWEDAYVARKIAASGVEMTVVRCADEEAAAHALDCLDEYRLRRQEDLDIDDPTQGPPRIMLSRAMLLHTGRYAAMFSCPCSVYAAQIFDQIMDTGEVPEPVPVPDDVDELMDRMLSFYEYLMGDLPEVERIGSGDPERLSAIVDGEYGLADYPWEDAAIVRGTEEGSVFELAILRFPDFDAAFDSLYPPTWYLDAKEEEYARFPAQAEQLNMGSVGTPAKTPFLILTVCGDPYLLRAQFSGYLKAESSFGRPRHSQATKPIVDYDPDWPGRVKFAPPNEEDMSLYDTSAIRAAWAAEDPAGLSQEDRAVYDAAQEILGEILQEGMSELEKEEAIYRWIVDDVGYDWSHMDVMAETSRAAYEPYGALVDRSAVCLGYATAFQLLCDLAGVECITVVGACFNSTGDHAWNMVRLHDEWYCVDPTWDATGREQLGEEFVWRYFNVTSGEMAESHQWDYANVPEATAEDHGA